MSRGSFGGGRDDCFRSESSSSGMISNVAGAPQPVTHSLTHLAAGRGQSQSVRSILTTVIKVVRRAGREGERAGGRAAPVGQETSKLD